MSNIELLSKTLSDVAAQIKKKAISPVDLVRAELDHIEKMGPVINSFITVLADQALESARRLEAELMDGKYRGPLHGIPFGAKDNLMTAGIRTTAGSKILKDWVPEEDTTAITRAREAGAILLGKENCHEFASGTNGYNPHYGQVHNPWDLTRVPGGSSSGSGASVGSLQTFFSFGTDGGGSGRIPASLCGAVALKATHGRIPIRGALPPFSSSDHIAPITRSVRDCALILQVVAGYDGLDPTSVPIPVPDYLQGLDQPIGALVMGIPTNFYFDGIDPEVEAAVRRAISLLGELGVKARNVSINHIEHRGAGADASNLLYHEKWIKTRPQDYDPDVLYRMLPGIFATAMDAAKDQRFRRILKVEFAKAMQEVDFLVTPTIPVVAFPIAAESIIIKGMKISVKGPGAPSRTLARYTGPSNSTGLPSLTIPCGFNSEGMPIGLQLIGKPFQEDILLRVGHQYEMATKKNGILPASIA